MVTRDSQAETLTRRGFVKRVAAVGGVAAASAFGLGRLLRTSKAPASPGTGATARRVGGDVPKTLRSDPRREA